MSTRSANGGDPRPFPPPGGCELEPLLIDLAELARLTSLGLRTLRRLDAQRAIPGRVTFGRRVLFRLGVIREWVESVGR
jgi:predicted DNA-binding transcriptional regulator AlpA